MSESTDLNAQLAQRLFGFAETAGVHGYTLWKDSEGTIHYAIPHYTTNPAATALVWQWLEHRDGPLCQIRFLYGDNLEIDCVVSHGGSEVVGWGATWQAALCRAALALAEALEGEKK